MSVFLQYTATMGITDVLATDNGPEFINKATQLNTNIGQDLQRDVQRYTESDNDIIFIKQRSSRIVSYIN